MGISFLISFLSFRALANVVRSQIYFVSFLVWYYPQEATIIVLGKVSLLLDTQMYVAFTPFMQYIWSNILVGKFIIHVFQ